MSFFTNTRYIFSLSWEVFKPELFNFVPDKQYFNLSSILKTLGKFYEVDK